MFTGKQMQENQSFSLHGKEINEPMIGQQTPGINDITFGKPQKIIDDDDDTGLCRR